MRLHNVIKFNYNQTKFRYNSDLISCSKLIKFYSADSVNKCGDNQLLKKEEKDEKKDKIIKAKAKLNELLRDVKMKDVTTNEETISDQLAKPKNKKKVTSFSSNVETPNGLQTRLFKAAKLVADKVKDKDESKKIEATLFKMVELQEKEKKLHTPEVVQNIEDMIKNMGKEKSVKHLFSYPYDDSNKTNEQQNIGFKEKPPKISFKKTTRPSSQKINYYSSESLNIFPVDCLTRSPEVKLKTWERLSQEELEFLGIQSPTNAYEEMIMWTNKKMLWSYPIDNEAGLEEEAKVPFYEHVLLDYMLEDFYKTGPVRDFMDLVVIGLTNNPFINVERKKAYIEWYLNYFKEKENLLKVAGAI